MSLVKTHQLKVTAYSQDTDRNCLVTPQSYLRYMDRGRLEAIEEICKNLGLSSWLDCYVVNVYKITARFMAPSHNGEQLTILSSLHKTSSHRAVFLQRVMNSQGQAAAEAFIELLFLDGSSKQLVPVPEELPVSSLPKINNERGLIPVPFSHQEHFKFIWPLRVYYEDTDAQGITYHVSYFNFCQRAFVEYLRELLHGENPVTWLAAHPLKIVRQINRYMKATHLTERLQVAVGVRRLENNYLLLDERVTNEAGEVCSDMMSEICFTDDGQVVDIPEPLRIQCS